MQHGLCLLVETEHYIVGLLPPPLPFKLANCLPCGFLSIFFFTFFISYTVNNLLIHIFLCAVFGVT